MREVTSWLEGAGHLRPKGRLMSVKNSFPTLRQNRSQSVGMRWSCLYARDINIIAILSLIFIMWQIEMLVWWSFWTSSHRVTLELLGRDPS